MTMPIANGSVVKIWNGSRGHDYVVVAVNRTSKQIGLIKHTCINQDGNIRSNTVQVHKWISYEEFGVQKIVPRITRVVGTREVNNAILSQFLADCGHTGVIAARVTHNIVANPDGATDARQAFAL
jgi:hypothetical protein